MLNLDIVIPAFVGENSNKGEKIAKMASVTIDFVIDIQQKIALEK